MPIIHEEEFTFVTNNAVDFRRLYGKQDLHAGLVILIPNVTPRLQRELFRSILGHLGDRELINAVIEIDSDGENSEINEYEWP